MILYATVVLMVVIFMELALQTVVVKFSISWWIFYVVNYIPFTFFIIKIYFKFFLCFRVKQDGHVQSSNQIGP